MDSAGGSEGTFEAFDITKAELPGSAKLPSATCSYRYTSKGEDSAAAYFGFYLTEDDARADAIGEALTSAGYVGAQHAWSSPPAEDGSHVIVDLTSIEDAGIEGDAAFLEALGTEGDILSVIVG